MTREGLEISICVDARAALESGACLLRLSGTADDASLRTTSPAVVTQDLELKVGARDCISLQPVSDLIACGNATFVVCD